MKVQYVDETNPGTETFAAVTGAFAALAIALDIFGEQDAVEELRQRANSTYNLMERARTQSYAETFSADQVGSFWPSSPELADDKLLAAGLMMFSVGSEPDRFRCVSCAPVHSPHACTQPLLLRACPAAAACCVALACSALDVPCATLLKRGRVAPLS
jgi:Glycosyl hydrolase family 9